MDKHISVAIDGPSGAGKSTLARAAAARFGFIYVDTGAIYRTVGLAAARAGLLHDLYLYDPADPSSNPCNQCFHQPVAALRNAKALCPDLTEREANAILTHMFPLSAHLRRCREAAVVNLADKICATIEVAHLYRTRFIQRLLPAAAPA